MLKLAFYIIEPLVDHEKNEYKDSESGPADLILNTQNEWTYSEDISFDYAFTQSVLFKIYGGMIQETGHKTRGHVSLTEYDRYYLSMTTTTFTINSDIYLCKFYNLVCPYCR